MKKLVIYPFLFAIYPVLFLISYNRNEAEIMLAIPPLLFCFGLAVFLYFVFYLLYKNKDKAGLMAGFALFIFFSYGHIYFILNKSVDIRHRLLLPFAAFLCVFVFVVLGKIKKSLEATRYLFNVMACVLSFMSLFGIVQYRLATRPVKEKISPVFDIKDMQVEHKPDIYYLIFDGYTSSNVLKNNFDYDNARIVDFLESKDFFVATESHSNYAMTFLSLASSLNMKHINDEASNQVSSKDFLNTSKAIKDNFAINFLKQQGYSYVHVGSWWGPVHGNKHADYSYNGAGLISEFFMSILQKSLLNPFYDFYLSYVSRRITDYALDSIEAIPLIKEPTFTFAHIVVPHKPFVFDAQGNKTNVFDAVTMDAQKGVGMYVDQVKYVNSRIKKLVNSIMDKSETKPIIIIQGDHGWTFESYGKMPVSDKAINERMSIFNAYYFPDKSEFLYPGITPVNTFVKLFNSYFNTSYKSQNDTSFFSVYDEPYKFINAKESFIKDSK